MLQSRTRPIQKEHNKDSGRERRFTSRTSRINDSVQHRAPGLQSSASRRNAAVTRNPAEQNPTPTPIRSGAVIHLTHVHRLIEDLQFNRNYHTHTQHTENTQYTKNTHKKHTHRLQHHQNSTTALPELHQSSEGIPKIVSDQGVGIPQKVESCVGDVLGFSGAAEETRRDEKRRDETRRDKTRRDLWETNSFRPLRQTAEGFLQWPEYRAALKNEENITAPISLALPVLLAFRRSALKCL